MKPTKDRPRLRCLSPFAGRLLVGGHMLLLISVCFFVALFHSDSRPEALLYIETYMASVGASAAVLWGVVLGIDWLEHRYRNK